MEEKEPITASEMGKRSAAARKKKYKIKDWSKHMKKVRKGKRNPVIFSHAEEKKYPIHKI